MILCSGCFDGLHAGHVAYLEAAAQMKRPLSEPLIVAVASDDYIRAHKHRAPRWSQADRMRVLQALRCVSGVVGHGTRGAGLVIHDLLPRLFVKGEDWVSRMPDDIVRMCEHEGIGMAWTKTGNYTHTSDALSAHQ